MEQIGYAIVDANGSEVKFWGDASGQCAGVPDFIDWPSKDRSYCPAPNMGNNGARFVARMLEQSEGDSASENIAFDGTQVVVTRVLARAVTPPPAAPTITDFESAIQGHIDAAARIRGYTSGLSLVSYLSSTNPTWAAEAAAFLPWRDAVWAYVYQQLALVQAAQRVQPTPSAFIDELPAIVWPS